MSDNESPSTTPHSRPLSYQQVVAKRLAPTLTAPVADVRTADRPMLLLAGPPGSGRTTMLDTIQDTYRHTPIAVLSDATTPKTWPGPEGSVEPGVPELLALIVNRLGVHRRHRRFGIHRLDAFTVCFALLHTDEFGLPVKLTPKTVDQFLRKLYFLRFARVNDLLDRSVPEAGAVAGWLGLAPRLLQGLIRGVGFGYYWRWKKELATRIAKCASLGPGNLYTRLDRVRSLYLNDPRSPSLETALCETLLSDLDSVARTHQRNAVNLVLVDDVDVDDRGRPVETGVRGRLLLRLARAHADFPGKRPWGPLAVIGTCAADSAQSSTFTEFGRSPDETDAQTPTQRLERALATFHGDQRFDVDKWFLTWRLPLPNRGDVRNLVAAPAAFRDDKSTLDWIRLSGRGDVAETRRLAERVAKLSRRERAMLAAHGALLRVDRPVDAAEVAALAEQSEVTDLGVDHPDIDDYGHFRPPATAQQVRRRVYAATAATAAAALVVVGGIVAVDAVQTWCDADGSIHRAGANRECVGVTDGSYVFHEEFAEVSAAIKAENDRVLADGPDGGHVAIVFFTPMTNFSGSENTDDIQSTMHQLQGAYEALYQANHSTINKPRNQIRLLLANPGANAEQWEPVVDDLVAKRDAGPDRVIGAAGFGSSYRGTGEAIAALSAAGIPTMAAVATADGLMRDKPGAYRISPDNTSEVRAMVDSLHRDPKVEDAILVKDRNPDDSYTRTLADAFERYFPDRDHEIVATAPYTSNVNGVSENLRAVVSDVCSYKPDVVYFAGRGRGDLPDFIDMLADRNCRDLPIRIATGDDASHFPDEPGKVTEQLWRNDITVEYSGLVHPSQWDASTPNRGIPESNRAKFEANLDRFVEGVDGDNGYRAHFGAESKLADGQAIMAFDAVTVLVEGVRRLAQGYVDSAGLLNTLQSVHDCRAVTTTLSGLIALDEDGNAANKTIVIVRYEGPRSPKILGLAWPEGEATPMRQNC